MNVEGGGANRRKGPIVGVVIALVLAAGAAWYFLSPGMAMAAVREAAQRKDKQELAERIDFPAIRESLKSQAMAAMTVEMAKKSEDNPFAALGGAIAIGFIGPLVDSLVTPTGIVAMIEHGRFQDPTKPAEEIKDPKTEWTVEREGFERFRAISPMNEDGKRVSLVFQRDGLGWQMVDIEMPNMKLGNTPASAASVPAEPATDLPSSE